MSCADTAVWLNRYNYFSLTTNNSLEFIYDYYKQTSKAIT